MTVYCENCGAGVTDDFARVFGDNDNTFKHCPDCNEVSVGDLGYGAAAGLDTDHRKASRGGAF